jgi:putative flippase GtrA
MKSPSQRFGDHARILRFLIVGGTATAVYFGLALAASSAGLAVEISHLIAFAVSIVVSYFGQKLFTFRVQGEHARNVTRFAIATAGISTLQFLLVAGLNAVRIDRVLIFLASSAFYPAASFLVHSYWTFRQPAKTDRAQTVKPLSKSD